MFIIKIPAYKIFWNQRLQYSIVADNMSQNWFEKLRTNVHFVNNTFYLPPTNLMHDKVFKVRSFLEAIKTNFKVTN